MLRKRWWVCAGAAVLATACESGRSPTLAPEITQAGPRLTGWTDVTYPLHWYGDETDSWAYMTSIAPAYVEIVADVQTPHPDDGYGKKRVCPNDQYIGRNAHLRMNYGLETLDFDFRGPFTFVRHVSTTSPYPTAAYTFHRHAYTYDNKYYAPAGGQVLLACDGYYVLDNRSIRLWVGHLYGKNYTGPIVRNPNYDDPDEDGCGDAGSKADVYEDPYNPYDDGDGCDDGDDGGTGSGTQYEPGDYTGGETVDWQTGVGNGGTSVCGAKAVVDYICIDIWDESSQSWKTWDCGYATTC